MFQSALAKAAEDISAHLKYAMSTLGDDQVADAMRYATSGGKRLRGFLVLESAGLHDVDPAQAIWPAAAIEAVHAYSLIHDDLPCMDDDDLRRGMPTVHRQWDEATAVLAGDGLQALAFEWVTSESSHPDAAVRVGLASGLARSAGARGMVLGQALDIAAESAETPLTLDQITHLQAGKTGALFDWSATAGAVMAKADTAPLSAYAAGLGLAFQIADDILDVEGDAAKVGKRLQKDTEAGKATFVSLLGLEAARSKANSLVEEACDALALYGVAADRLKDCARFVVSRDT